MFSEDSEMNREGAKDLQLSRAELRELIHKEG